MRLQNNPISQALADRQARKDGSFFFADYVGIHEGRLVYVATHEDSEVRYEGFPTLIYVDADGNVSESIGLESLDVIHQFRHRDYRKGREIFRRYKRCLEMGGECAPFEREYWDEVVRMVEGGGYDCPVDATIVYRFLEAADRLGMKLEFRPEPRTMDRNDGWEYYVALVEKNEYTEEEYYWACGGNTGTLPQRITPSRINYMNEYEVFVYGSNIYGRHGAGAAAFAMKRFGAVWGVGEGLTGRSYALPTMEGPDNLRKAVERFTNFAREHAGLQFFVTPVGCGIAGYTPEDVAPLFKEAASLNNVNLPVSFWKRIIEI